MRARSTNILDSTYITPVVQASSKTRAAMLMVAYNALRKPQMRTSAGAREWSGSERSAVHVALVPRGLHGAHLGLPMCVICEHEALKYAS